MAFCSGRESERKVNRAVGHGRGGTAARLIALIHSRAFRPALALGEVAQRAGRLFLYISRARSRHEVRYSRKSESALACCARLVIAITQSGSVWTTRRPPAMYPPHRER